MAAIAAPASASRYIIEANSTIEAHQRAEFVGATVEQELDIIHGVTAELTPAQVAQLRASATVRLYTDRAVGTKGKLASLVTNISAGTTLTDGSGVSAFTFVYQTDYPALVGADTLQKAGITGKGVTIAILDTGLWQDRAQRYSTITQNGTTTRILASIDVLNGGNGAVTGDPYGHGTHITSIAAGGAMNLSGNYLGIAPQANLVIDASRRGIAIG